MQGGFGYNGSTGEFAAQEVGEYTATVKLTDALVIDSVEDLVPARRPRDQVLYLPVPRYFPYRRRQDKEIEIKSVFQRVIVVDRDPARQLYVDSVALVRTERI